MPLVSPYNIIASSLEPARKSHFSVDFQSPLGSMPEIGRYSLRSIPPPPAQLRADPATVFNSQLYVPGVKAPAGDIVLLHILYLDDTILNWWKDWFKLLYDPETDRVGLLNEVVGQGSITIHYPTGTKSDMKIELHDCFPGSVKLAHLDVESAGEPATFEVTLYVTDVVY